MTRLVPLLLVALACTACRSARVREERPHRDYTSLNRASLSFLKEANRKTRAERRDNLRRAFAVSRRAESNRSQRAQGRRFAAASFATGARTNTRAMWRGLKHELSWPDDLGARARFGFLDSGD